MLRNDRKLNVTFPENDSVQQELMLTQQIEVGPPGSLNLTFAPK